MEIEKNTLYLGDCLDLMKYIEDNTIQLIVTSPPYANQRKKIYGGIDPEYYSEWFLERSQIMLDKLSPNGTFILNIKEHVEKGVRHPYVYQLVLDLIQQGWYWTEEWIWCKKSSYPGRWNNRFRNQWERIYQFNKNKKFDMHQDRMKIPAAESSFKRYQYKYRQETKTGSGFSSNSNREYLLKHGMALPSNVLHIPNSSFDVPGAAACFHVSLPTFFIKLFSNENELIVDPFCGAGTSIIAAKNENRNYIGIEINQQQFEIAENRILGKYVRK